jgi:hypothetical protein
MKTIKLTQNKIALVDDENFENLSKFKWFARKDKNTFYAGRTPSRKSGKRTMVQMHTQIMETPKGMEVDHIDSNGLNNQRSNLRICTRKENVHNATKRTDNTSGYKGVSFYKLNKKWGANISCDGEHTFLGLFATKEEAYEAYVGACVKFHREFARIK